MEQPKLTARQVEVLTAELQGQHVRTSTPLRNVLRSAGYTQQSARHIIARELGYREWDLPRIIQTTLPDELRKDCGGVSVAGLQVLDAHLRGGRRYDPTDARLAQIRAALPIRRALDEQRTQWLAEYRAKEADRANRIKVARDRALIQDVRTLLVRAGFGPVLHELADDKDVLQLVRAIRNAEHGTTYFCYLDDMDLSQLLDEAEQEAVRPGSIGDTMRSETINAIRAEFARRAKA